MSIGRRPSVVGIAFPEDTICAALRGEPRRWRYAGDAEAIARFLDAGRHHGVLPLLAAEIQGGRLDDWPEEILTACRDGARNQAMYELADRAAVRRVVCALSSAGATPLVLKGSGLAYSLYSNPILRPRGDTDLLIRPDQRSEAERALGELGYIRHEATEGKFISYQASWTRSDAFGAEHHVDLHWRINNSQILAKVADYDELAVRAVPVQALGPDALTLCPVDALLFACIHRAGHVHAPYFVDGVAHHAVDRLIWLYDIHLLVSTLSDAEMDEFASLAAVKRIKAICRDGLSITRERLGTPIPPHILEALGAPGAVEPSACFLTGGRARLMIENFRALDRWTDRMGWVRELAFPSGRYMHAKYPEARIKWLPVLYMRRGLTGISRLIASGNAGDAR